MPVEREHIPYHVPDGSSKPREDARHLSAFMSATIGGNDLCPCFSLSSRVSVSQLSCVIAYSSLDSSGWWTSLCWLQLCPASSHRSQFLVLRPTQQPCFIVCLLKTLFICQPSFNYFFCSQLSLSWLFIWSERSAAVYWKLSGCQEFARH